MRHAIGQDALSVTASSHSVICSSATCMPRIGSGTTRRSSRRWKIFCCTGAPARRVGRPREASHLLSRAVPPVWRSVLNGWCEIKTFGFGAAGLAEIAKRVDQAAVGHLLELWESFVRLQICIDNPFNELVGALDDRC